MILRWMGTLSGETTFFHLLTLFSGSNHKGKNLLAAKEQILSFKNITSFLFWKDFFLQGSKQEVTKVFPFGKMGKKDEV